MPEVFSPETYLDVNYNLGALWKGWREDYKSKENAEHEFINNMDKSTLPGPYKKKHTFAWLPVIGKGTWFLMPDV